MEKRKKKLDAIIEPTADYILSQMKLPTKLIHFFSSDIFIWHSPSIRAHSVRSNAIKLIGEIIGNIQSVT